MAKGMSSGPLPALLCSCRTVPTKGQRWSRGRAARAKPRMDTCPPHCPNGGARVGRLCSPAPPAPVRLYNVHMDNEGGLPPGSRRFFREAGREIPDQAMRKRPMRAARPRICGFSQSGAPCRGGFVAPQAAPLDPGSPGRAAHGRIPRVGRAYDKAGGPCRRLSSQSRVPADEVAGHCESRRRPAPLSLTVPGRRGLSPAVPLGRSRRRPAAPPLGRAAARRAFFPGPIPVVPSVVLIALPRFAAPPLGAMSGTSAPPHPPSPPRPPPGPAGSRGVAAGRLRAARAAGRHEAGIAVRGHARQCAAFRSLVWRSPVPGSARRTTPARARTPLF